MDTTSLEDFELFLDSLNGEQLEKEMNKLCKSKLITLDQLKSVYNLAVKLYSTMQLKEAESVFFSYSVLCPSDHRGIGGMAAIYLERKEYKKALDTLNILKTYPTCQLDEVFLDISLCHYKLKEYTNSTLVFVIVKQENLSEFYISRYHFLNQQLQPYF